MGLIIILRKQRSPNRFKKLLIDSIDTGLGNNVLLCSGFFQENFNKSNYQVSLETGFIDALKRNQIELTTVGIHNYMWKKSYQNFRDNLDKEKVNIKAKLAKKFKWHAKIFILKKDDKPIFGIVGSSNMTRNAFGEEDGFNYEADVVLWLDEYTKFNQIVDISLIENEQNHEVINVDYDIEKNYGLTIEQRLTQLNDDVMKNDLKELD